MARGRNGPGAHVAFTISRVPDLQGMVERIKAERRAIYERAGQKLIGTMIPQAIASQGRSVGTEWGNRTKWAGGAPALVSQVGRFRLRVSDTSLAIVWDHPWASLLQYGGQAKSKGKRFALPFPGVTGSPRDYRDTFVRPAAKSGVFVVLQRTGNGPRDFKPLFVLSPTLGFPRRLVLAWFRAYQVAVEAEVEDAIERIAETLTERAA